DGLPTKELTGDLTGNLAETLPAEELTGKLPLVDGVLPGLQGVDLDSLDLAGLTGLADDLDLPSDRLPAIELQIVGRAISAECLGTPSGDVYSKATPVEAEVVAVVADRQIPVAKLPPEGLSLKLTDVL